MVIVHKEVEQTEYYLLRTIYTGWDERLALFTLTGVAGGLWMYDDARGLLLIF